MQVLFCALALLSGVIGAGFASGREIARFFCGPFSTASITLAALSLLFFFLRLCVKMESFGVSGVTALCAARFSPRLGTLCSALFFLLAAVTAGAMLAACAELCALTLPIPHAYGLGMGISLPLALLLARRNMRGLALPGAALLVFLPVLFLRLFSLPAGEACFYPAMAPDFPVRALTDGVFYAALNAAMLLGMAPMLLSLKKQQRQHAVFLFAILFFALLFLGSAVLSRHPALALSHPMPFLALSRELSGGYLLIALCMYAAAFSTLVAMMASLLGMLPLPRPPADAAVTATVLLFARAGFSWLVQSAYPVLGAVCAGLLFLLCV